MTGAISRLRMRAPPGHAATARARTEDALRLAAPDDRLLIVRRLDLGRLGVRSTPAEWNARAAERVAALRHRAIHAATPGAASAEAVWFRSVEEAETLLLRELASGRTPSAWFWRLAVRGWRGAPLTIWLPQRVAEAAGDPLREVALAHAMVAVALAGYLPALAAALALAPLPVPVVDGPITHGMVDTAGGAVPPLRQPADNMAARVHHLLARHDPVVRAAILTAIAAAHGEGPAARWIARLGLLAAAPELAAQPALWAEATAELLALATPAGTAAGIERVPLEAAPGWTEDAPPNGRRSAERRPAPAAEPAGSPNAAPSPARDPTATVSDARPALPEEAAASADRPHVSGSEQESLGAGVFLLVRPLVLMGLPEWLDRRPTLAVDGFGRALLQAIAQRMRIEDDDPLFAILNAEPVAAWNAPLIAWRVGLDRWLRRTARIRLAEVVRRRGWISAAPESVAVRFRVNAADIRLRRRALDIDPGWVPWLGRVVRYHYRDEPVPERCA